MASVVSSLTQLTQAGLHFGDVGTEEDYVRLHGSSDGALVLGGGAEGVAPVRVRNVQDAHLLTDAATWGQVVAATDSAMAAAASGATYKAPCAASSQGPLATVPGEGGMTLTIALDTEGYDGTLWTFGGRTLSSIEAGEGARVLVRHGASVLGAEDADHSFNGIYYFAGGHGLGSEDGPLVLTRATDMDANTDVRGATTYVAGGTDAGKVFVVTEPEDYDDGFELGTGDILWTAHTDQTVAQAVQETLKAVTDKRPCLVSTGAALNVTGMTATTLTIDGFAYLSGDGSWVIGGRSITPEDADNGARVLVRHSVILDLITYNEANGIYYFAPGHGVAIGSAQFVLTRAPDMATDDSVSGASVAVLSGDDAGCRFLVTLPQQGQAFDLGTGAIEWTGARGNDAAATVLAGAGVAVAGGGTVSLHLDTLDAAGSELLEGTTGVAVDVDGVTRKCSLQQLAAFEQTLSNKTLAAPLVTGNVGFDEDAVLQVAGTDLVTMRAGSLAVTGTLSATTLMAQAVVGPSDINLKDAVEKCPGLDAVRLLEGAMWTWKSDRSPGMGLIAQWLARVQPSLVVEGPGGLGILYNGVTGMLVNAVNDLDAALKAVVARVQTLEDAARPSGPRTPCSA